MHHQLMDQKRPVFAAKVSSSGCVICKSGKYAIALMDDGTYRVYNHTTGMTMMEGLTEEEVDDLFKISMTAKRWGKHHTVVK